MVSITDKITRATDSSTGRPIIATLAAPGKTIGAPSITLSGATNWTTSTPVYVAIYTTTAAGIKDPTTQTDWKATLSGTTLSNMTITGGTDRDYNTGAYVEITFTSAWAKDMYDWMAVHGNADGSLKTSAVQTALGLGASSLNGWNALGYTFSSVTYNGNRSYDCVVSGQDVTGTISAGMRLRTTRTVAAPNQCTSLNGTTQYYSKTSPAGMTFTDDFVAGAWIKLSSYPSSQATLISRYNGTSGWQLRIESNGQVGLLGFNASSANYSSVTSYQSVPLNKWVHIAAQLDMSTFTATTTTSYIMIDGVDVPSFVFRAGTNPTALVQAGDLQVGAANGATALLTGKIAQAFVSSAKITQANVRTLISQGLTSALISSNSIISAYSFNNAITDLNTTNANNLTANGSAVATNADSPFGNQADGTISTTLDYSVIESVSFSTNTTVTVRVLDGNTIPTSGGVSSVVYSSNVKPYGFPAMSRVISEVLQLSTFSSTTIAGVDVPALTTPALTIPANKKIRLITEGQMFKTGTAGDTLNVNLYEDSTVKYTWQINMTGSNYAAVPLIVTPTIYPTAGSHTYKVNISSNAAGTMQFVGLTTAPAYLRVEYDDL